MPTRHLSLRIDVALFDRLERESVRTNQNRSELAKTLIEEGLRMEAHPGIVFRPGPAGRRAGLANGPDVWEIVRAYLNCDDTRGDAVELIAETANLSQHGVRDALRYYSAYRAEIDERIHSDELAAEEGYAAWLQEQQVLGRSGS